MDTSFEVNWQAHLSFFPLPRVTVYHSLPFRLLRHTRSAEWLVEHMYIKSDQAHIITEKDILSSSNFKSVQGTTNLAPTFKKKKKV